MFQIRLDGAEEGDPAAEGDGQERETGRGGGRELDVRRELLYRRLIAFNKQNVNSYRGPLAPYNNLIWRPLSTLALASALRIQARRAHFHRSFLMYVCVV